MDRRQAEQHSLMESRVEVDSLAINHPPETLLAQCWRCFKWLTAFSAVTGSVILGVVVVFILFGFIAKPSCDQDAGPPCGKTKVVTICQLKQTEEEGKYDIFIADKAGRYLVYGWIKCTDSTSEEVTLKHVFEGKTSTLEKKKSKNSLMFVSTNVMLLNTSRITIEFNSNCTRSLFHVFYLES